MQPTIEAPLTASEEAYDTAAPTHEFDRLKNEVDAEAAGAAADADTDATLELILTSDEHPLALARSLGVTLDHLLAFLDGPPVRRRLAQIERLHALRRAHADRLAELAAKQTLTRLAAQACTTPAEARTAQLQQRAASALLRSLKPIAAPRRERRRGEGRGAGAPPEPTAEPRTPTSRGRQPPGLPDDRAAHSATTAATPGDAAEGDAPPPCGATPPDPDERAPSAAPPEHPYDPASAAGPSSAATAPPADRADSASA